MSTYLKKEGNSYNIPIKEFECDDDSEVNSIDVTYIEPGTIVHVINDNKTYKLNSNKEWKPAPNPGDSGGGGGGGRCPRADSLTVFDFTDFVDHVTWTATAIEDDSE